MVGIMGNHFSLLTVTALMLGMLVVFGIWFSSIESPALKTYLQDGTELSSLGSKTIAIHYKNP